MIQLLPPNTKDVALVVAYAHHDPDVHWSAVAVHRSIVLTAVAGHKRWAPFHFFVTCTTHRP